MVCLVSKEVESGPSGHLTPTYLYWTLPWWNWFTCDGLPPHFEYFCVCVFIEKSIIPIKRSSALLFVCPMHCRLNTPTLPSPCPSVRIKCFATTCDPCTNQSPTCRTGKALVGQIVNAHFGGRIEYLSFKVEIIERGLIDMGIFLSMSIIIFSPLWTRFG